MKLVSTKISDLKAEFEGGNSLSLDWYGLLRRAGDTMLGQVYPDTLKRKVPVYGGLAKDIYACYCPTDVLVPSALYPLVGDRVSKYRPPQYFYDHPEELDIFTIEYINKVRFLVARYGQDTSSITVDDMDEVGTKTGTATSIALNEFRYINGTGAIQATFGDGGAYISDTLSAVIDITDYLRGIAVVPLFWSDGDIVSSITLQLVTSVGNYYQVISTADSIGDNFIDGWNILRFSLESRTSTGTPDSESIASWKLIVTMESGQSQTVVIDSITLEKSKAHDFEYYSSYLFVDGTTGAFKAEPEDGDYINLDRDALGILHWEAARKVGRKPISGLDFSTELAREYDQYYLNHPSSAQPISYSIASDVPVPGQSSSFDLSIPTGDDDE